MLVNQSRYDVDSVFKARMYMSRLFRVCFMGILPVVFVGLGIALIFVEGVSLFFPIFLFVFAVGSVALFAVFFWRLERRLIEKELNGKSGDVVCVFSDDGFTVRAENESLGNVENEAYAALTKCAEYADMWLLYRGSLVLPLDKSGMTEGTAEELSVFLAVKLGNRYHVKYRKQK